MKPTAVGDLCTVVPRDCEGQAWFDTGRHRTQLETGTVALVLEFVDRRLGPKHCVACRVMIGTDVGWTWKDNLQRVSAKARC